MTSHAVRRVTCYDCGRRIPRREAVTVEAHIFHEETATVPICPEHEQGEEPDDDDPRIRVVCEDCELDRIWPRPANAELHPHDRNTDHTVGYEAAHEEARSETEVDNR